jgi:hypothetical protein
MIGTEVAVASIGTPVPRVSYQAASAERALSEVGEEVLRFDRFDGLGIPAADLDLRCGVPYIDRGWIPRALAILREKVVDEQATSWSW